MKRKTEKGNDGQHTRGFAIISGMLCALLLLTAASLLLPVSKNGALAQAVFVQGAKEKADSTSKDAAPSSLISPRSLLSAQIPSLAGVSFVFTPDSEGDPSAEQSKDEVSEEIKIEILNLKNEDLSVSPLKNIKEPTILIYHTHTLEAYKQTDPPYEEKGAFRTQDESQSVVRIGSELKSRLEGFGYTVIHDTTNHEPPKLSTSYDRSLETVEKYRKQYPSLKLFIDVHRDAYNTESTYHDVVQVDGKDAARVMMVVGTGERYDDTYVKPNWKENYKLALGITNAMNSINSRFARDIRVKTGRYNQHVSDMCLLIEVGHNANTLDEALVSAEYLSCCIDRILSGSP